MFRTLIVLALVGLGPALACQGLSAQSAAAVQKAAAPVVNINTADAAALSTLPGIGARTAELIIAYRQKNGPFKKIEELMNVRGIGEKSFLKIRPQVSVGPAKTGGHQHQ